MIYVVMFFSMQGGPIIVMRTNDKATCDLIAAEYGAKCAIEVKDYQ